MQHYFRHRGTVYVLQAGRALASTAVLVHHAALSTRSFVGDVPSWLDGIADRAIGFNFFFVLSGFIVLYSHGGDNRTGYDAIIFIYKRLTRVFVPYIPVSIGLVFAYILLPDWSKGDRTWGFFSTLTLLPAKEPPALQVAWTLQHELIFYSLFVCFYFVRSAVFLVGLWGAAILAGWTSGAWASTSAPFLIIAFHPLNLMFIAGMAAAVIVREANDQWWPAPLAIGLAAAIACLLAGESLGARVGFGIAMAPIAMAFIMLERGKKIRVPNWLVTYGSASYAIYLIHHPVISLVSRLAVHADCWAVTLTSGVIASLIIGLLYHHLVERRMMSYCKARIPTRMISSMA